MHNFRVYWISLHMFWTVFRPSSGVQDYTHSIRYMSYRLVDCLLAGMRLNSFHLVPASKQSTDLYDIYLMLFVQPWTPDDGWKDCPKHVERYSVNPKIAHLVGCLPCSLASCYSNKYGQIDDCVLLWCCTYLYYFSINPLNTELNPICYLLALLSHHFLHVSRIRVNH